MNALNSQLQDLNFLSQQNHLSQERQDIRLSELERELRQYKCWLQNERETIARMTADISDVSPSTIRHAVSTFPVSVVHCPKGT